MQEMHPKLCSKFWSFGTNLNISKKNSGRGRSTATDENIERTGFTGKQQNKECKAKWVGQSLSSFNLITCNELKYVELMYVV